MNRRAAWAAPAGAALAVSAGVAALLWRNPWVPGNWPTCPFLAVTGRWCPGCGSMRAAHSLVSGDVPAALSANPAAVVLAAVAIWVLVAKAARRAGWTLWDPTRWRWASVAAATSIGVFWVARNLPGAEVLAPPG